MLSVKKSGRIIGLLFFVVMLTWGAGFGLIYPLIEAPDFLSGLPANTMRLHLGVLFELIEVACVLAITFLIFPIFKKYSEVQALAYLGFRMIEAVMLVVGLLAVLMLLTVSQEYGAVAGGEASGHFETWGIVLKDLRNNWGLFVLALFHPLAALPLYYFFYKTNLVPRFLSIWGFLAAAWILIDEVILGSFGLGLLRIGGNPIAGIPMGANEIVLGIWLMIKGFNEEATIPDAEYVSRD